MQLYLQVKKPGASAKVGAAKGKCKPIAKPKSKKKSVSFNDDDDFMDVSSEGSDDDTSQVNICSIKQVELVMSLVLNLFSVYG